jgi:hypothetical protein
MWNIYSTVTGNWLLFLLLFLSLQLAAIIGKTGEQMEKYKVQVLVTSATISMVETEVEANSKEEAEQKAKQAAEDGECIYLWDDEDFECDYKIFETKKIEKGEHNDN